MKRLKQNNQIELKNKRVASLASAIALVAMVAGTNSLADGRGKIGKDAGKVQSSKDAAKDVYKGTGVQQKDAGSKSSAEIIGRPSGAGAAGANPQGLRVAPGTESATPRSSGGNAATQGTGAAATGSGRNMRSRMNLEGTGTGAHAGSAEEANGLKAVGGGKRAAAPAAKDLTEAQRAQVIKLAETDLMKDSLGTPKNPNDTTVRTLFGNKDLYSSSEAAVKQRLDAVAKLLPAAQKGQGQAIVGEYLSRINRLPDAQKAAALKEFDDFVAKLEELSKGNDQVKALIPELIAGALARSGVKPKPGETDMKDRSPLASITSKLEAYKGDIDALTGLTHRYTAFAKSYYAAIDAQLKANPKLGRAGVDYHKAALEAVEGMRLWTHNRLAENGVKPEEIERIKNSLCDCDNKCAA